MGFLYAVASIYLMPTTKALQKKYMQQLFSNGKQSMETIEQCNNTVVFSSLSEFYEPVKSTGFAIKYVVEGSELYTLDHQQYFIKQGNYLLCNSTKKGHVEIESRHKVKGICINISPELMLEAVASLRSPDTLFPDAELGRFFSTPYFLESQYQADKTAVGKMLIDISDAVQQKQLEVNDVTIEFFYSLSEKIITDQLPVFKQLQCLPGIKPPTKRELYKRISRGKEMMDACFTSHLSIQNLAQEACMSQYHFFRLFKKMVGLSPHQYILNKRLELGKKLLEEHLLPVSSAAVECGFNDIYSFSKAFKKQFGITPSTLFKK